MTATLTAPERNALQHAANGLSLKQMGPAMGVSPRTAEVYCIHARKKLGARNIAQAVALGFRTGVLS